MATGSMVPYSNPAGNNQTTPGAGFGLNQGGSHGILGTAAPTTPVLNPTQVAATNPLIPASSVIPGAAPGGAQVPNAGSVSTNDPNSSKQLTDIFGKGIGGDIENLLGSIGGTDSATLQEFIASLAPQEATAQANLNASLGAGGVSANSSVAALGNANLQAQETASIAGETAQLTQSGQQLEANILQGTQQSAQAEVADSGWNVFGEVMGGLGNLAATTISAAGKAGGFSNLF